MRMFQAATLTELHDQMCTTLVEADKSQLDVISSVDVQIHDVIAQADSMDWEFNLKSMWLTKSRWTTMVNQYVDPERLTNWVNMITEKIGTKNRGIALMQFNEVKPRGGAATGHTNKQTRTWGACMKTISYKVVPEPTITLHSRTSYLGYIGALDLTVAWMCAKVIAEATGVDIKNIKFIWMNEAIQWHNFKSLAFLLNHPDKKRRKHYRRLMMKSRKKLSEEELTQLDNSPALTLSKKWLAKVIKEDKDGVTYGDMTYNTYRRIRRRWHTEVHGLEFAQEFEGASYYKTGPKKGEEKEYFKAYRPLPDVWAKDLDFSALEKKGASLGGVEFVGGEMDEEDEDE